MLGLRGAVLLGKTIKSGIACFHLAKYGQSNINTLMEHDDISLSCCSSGLTDISSVFKVQSRNFFNDKKNSGIFSFHFAQAYSVHFELSLFSEL